MEEALLDAGSTRSSQAALLQVQSSERLQGNNTCNTFAGTTLALVLAEPENGRDRQAEGGAHTRAHTHTHTHETHGYTGRSNAHTAQVHTRTRTHAHTHTFNNGLEARVTEAAVSGRKDLDCLVVLEHLTKLGQEFCKSEGGGHKKHHTQMLHNEPTTATEKHTHTHTHKGEEGGRREGEQAQMKTRANSNAQPFLPQTNLG